MNVILFLFSFLIICTELSLSQGTHPKRELRGAWIATVANVDWPSSPYVTSGEKIKELVEIFNRLSYAGINTVYFQVRTECDALYRSELEPWSFWLTGEQGKEPEPFFDPLEFAVDEAHKLGIELHAWLNPFRAVKNEGEYPPAAGHISRTHPQWILSFRSGTGDYKMLDPGIPAVRDYITGVVSDIVSRYKVDGIHFDDYFYPYEPKISNEDSASFAYYGKGFYDIDAWRRNNINLMIAEVYDRINSLNPDVKFGISPFGILENKYAATKGFESYSVLYGDPLTWIKEKTVDYLIPQIYWKIGDEKADFAKLLPWWASVADEVNLFAGIFATRFTDSIYSGSKTEIADQIKMIRNADNVQGMVFFSSKTISRNFSGFADSLRHDYFRYPALVPLMPWKDSIPPHPPVNLHVEGNYFSRTITWDIPPAAADGDTPKQYVVYRFTEKEFLDLTGGKKSFHMGNPEFIIHIGNADQNSYKDSKETDSRQLVYMVTALDKFSNESNPAEFIFISNSGQKEW